MENFTTEMGMTMSYMTGTVSELIIILFFFFPIRYNFNLLVGTEYKLNHIKKSERERKICAHVRHTLVRLAVQIRPFTLNKFIRETEKEKRCRTQKDNKIFFFALLCFLLKK